MLTGGPISWSTQKQGSVATSTCEAELNSLDEAAKQAHYLQELLQGGQAYCTLEVVLEVVEDKPTALFNNNQSALAAIKRSGGGKHRRTKHIKIKLRGLRELVNLQTISVGYHPTGTMPADGLTKSLGPTLFKHHLPRLLNYETDQAQGEC